MRAGRAGGSGRVGALRVGERVVLENDTLNVFVAVVVDGSRREESALSRIRRGQTGRESRGEDEAGSRAGASGQRPGDQTDLSGWRRRRHHRECQFQPNGHQRHSRLGQSRRRLHDRLQRSQPEQDSRGALIYLVHLHDQLGENDARPLHVLSRRTASCRTVV